MVSTSTYDAENRLTAMSGGVKASYFYDGRACPEPSASGSTELAEGSVECLPKGQSGQGDGWRGNDGLRWELLRVDGQHGYDEVVL